MSDSPPIIPPAWPRTRRRPRTDFKRLQRTSTDFSGLLPVRPQDASQDTSQTVSDSPRRLHTPQDASKMVQDAPKSPPRRAQEAPRGPQDGPTGPQEVPKTAQDVPRTPPRGPRTPPRRPKTPRIAQNRAKTAPRRPMRSESLGIFEILQKPKENQ